MVPGPYYYGPPLSAIHAFEFLGLFFLLIFLLLGVFKLLEWLGF